MTDEQQLPVADAAGPGEALPDSSVESIGELADPVAVEDMIPVPGVEEVPPNPEFPEEQVVTAEAAADDVAPTDTPAEQAEQAEDAAAEAMPAESTDAGDVAAAQGAVVGAVVASEVEPLTAADIPALEGCDVEKSWSGDEACEGTEAIAETPAEAEAIAAADPEADSGLEPAEGEVEAVAAVEGEQAVAPMTPTWPFIAYLVGWAVLCVVAGWQLLQIPAGHAIATSEAYRIAVLGGVAMTIAGPLLILAVWLASYFRSGERAKTGMLASSLLKGSVVTLLGVVMWWGTFLIVDQVRFGRFF